ncbi:MAG: PHP domain-containing protein [Candidatus Uhrbacteria bacterium]
MSCRAITNAEIAEAFSRIAALLEIDQANLFRIRAYERAAEVIAHFLEPLADIVAADGDRALREIPGIGDDLAAKIVELVTTGKLAFLKQLERRVPVGLLDVTAVEGMGPKRTAFVWRKFRVRSLADLDRLCRSGKLGHVHGWGERSVANILNAIGMLREFDARMPIGRALPLAESLAQSIERSGFCDRVEIAGSIRRRKETIGDIDLLATSAHSKRVIDVFCGLPLIRRVIARGETKANVLLKTGIEADLRVLDPEAFGAGLYYFTGSKQHNIHTRTIAMQKGLTISEYGVFRGTKEKKGKLVACRTEEDVFRAIGLPYIPPEIREDTGEIEAALAGRLPKLITSRDVCGDLHIHSDFSDGHMAMEEVIAMAKSAGYQYIAIADHASPMGMVRGLKSTKFSTYGGSAAGGQVPNSKAGGTVAEYMKRVRAAAKKVRGIHVLAGAEVDILADGRLYLPDDALKELDWVVGAIHQNFKQTEAQATRRIFRAMNNPYVRCIAHPTTRMIGARAEMNFDWDAMFREAHARGIAFELNAAWQRLDLDDVRCRWAKERGVSVCINSDAHTPDGFDLRFGIGQARRGWLERCDIVNALPWEKFKRLWLRTAHRTPVV